ncbi:uncharacterized protein LOC141613209 [Silene latifolia]|uniref:uncharacterized protein LOC141613209 n=1 Tax=Silene latifolia TaxID=37657 RepID=UPI003D77637C
MPENGDDSTTSGNSVNQNINLFDDPVCLSMSGHPGMHIVDTLFNGQNYTSWSRALTLALGSKNKLGFLDGTTAIPAAGTLRNQHWQRICPITIDSPLKESFLSSKSAKLMWSVIRERYGQCNGPLLFQLKKELRNISQNNSSIVEYFNKLKRNWDGIDELESYPDCSCGAMNLQFVKANS